MKFFRIINPLRLNDWPEKIIREQKNITMVDPIIVNTTDIKEYARIFLASYPNQLLSINRDYPKVAKKHVIEFESLRYDRLLSLQTEEQIADGIKLVSEHADGVLGLVARALICDAILHISRTSEALMKWMRLAFFQSKGNFQLMMDDLLMYEPILIKLGLLPNIAQGIEYLLRTFRTGQKISNEYLGLVANALDNDLQESPSFRIIRKDKKTEKNLSSYKMQLDYHLNCTNIDLDENNLPLIFTNDQSSFRIYDVERSQVKEIELTLSNHGYQAILEDGKVT